MPRRLTGRIEPRPTKLAPTSWVVRIGKGPDSYVGTYFSRDEAECARDEGLKERTERAHARSFARLWAQYMDEQEKAQRTRRGDAEQFNTRERSITRHVAGARWYRRRVEKVTHDDVRELLDAVVGAPAMRWHRGKGELVASGDTIGKRTGEQLRTRLRDFFAWVSKPSLPYNPAIGVKLPNTAPPAERTGADRVKHIHADELDRLWALPLEVFSLRERAVYAFGIYGGLRPGEIKGLQWPHLVRIMGARAEIHIRRSYHRLPKTTESQREFPALPQLIEHVQRWIDSLEVRPVTGLVFPSPVSGGCYTRNWDCRWDEIRAAAGIRAEIEWRHMRHTFGTHACSGEYTGGRELPVEYVQRALGHKSPATTRKHYVSEHVDTLHKTLERVTAK